jgi:aryl-alcohol dehydrogenase-like predicted oxidoreductase
MALPKRRLGNDLEVTALGYGAMGLEGSYGAELDRSEAVAFIRAALAPIRDRVVIATKFLN